MEVVGALVRDTRDNSNSLNDLLFHPHLVRLPEGFHNLHFPQAPSRHRKSNQRVLIIGSIIPKYYNDER